jgi:hypothetical protein
MLYLLQELKFTTMDFEYFVRVSNTNEWQLSARSVMTLVLIRFLFYIGNVKRTYFSTNTFGNILKVRNYHEILIKKKIINNNTKVQ